ncbi:MAG: amidohydrolase family protein, partial [Duncaniella sp.]|nr:amidohydrolase family protein [Duncaniella sp.]
MPMVQFSLTAMLDLMSSDPEAEGVDIARIVRLMCHAPASLLGIDRRGYLREGYYADLAIVRPLPMPGHRVTDSEVVSRCGWTPLDGRTLGWEVVDTIVNGGTGPRPLAFIRQ